MSSQLITKLHKPTYIVDSSLDLLQAEKRLNDSKIEISSFNY